jgi:hypothetical protein
MLTKTRRDIPAEARAYRIAHKNPIPDRFKIGTQFVSFNFVNRLIWGVVSIKFYPQPSLGRAGRTSASSWPALFYWRLAALRVASGMANNGLSFLLGTVGDHLVCERLSSDIVSIKGSGLRWGMMFKGLP